MKKDLYEGLGCGCMILAAGIAFFLAMIVGYVPEIVKTIWK